GLATAAELAVGGRVEAQLGGEPPEVVTAQVGVELGGRPEIALPEESGLQTALHRVVAEQVGGRTGELVRTGAEPRAAVDQRTCADIDRHSQDGTETRRFVRSREEADRRAGRSSGGRSSLEAAGGGSVRHRAAGAVAGRGRNRRVRA